MRLSSIGSWLLLLAIALAMRPLAAQSDYDAAYNRALTALQAGHPEQARQIVAELLAYGDKAELHNLLGDIEEAEQHPDQSAREYQAAARMDPSEKNLFDLGNELLLHRGFGPALQVFVFATGRYPGSARLQVGLGVAHYSLGQYGAAVDDLCRAVDLDPNDTRALDFIGRMYDASAGKTSEVTDRLASFLHRYPENPAANYYYALSLLRRTTTGASNDLAGRAEQLLLKAAALRPDWTDPHFHLAQLYEDEGKTTEAIAEYQAVTRLDPRLASAHYHLARLYRKTGRSKLAAAEYRAFARSKP